MPHHLSCYVWYISKAAFLCGHFSSNSLPDLILLLRPNSILWLEDGLHVAGAIWRLNWGVETWCVNKQQISWLWAGFDMRSPDLCFPIFALGPTMGPSVCQWCGSWTLDYFSLAHLSPPWPSIMGLHLHIPFYTGVPNIIGGQLVCISTYMCSIYIWIQLPKIWKYHRLKNSV